jgi:hypothetical protein
MKVNTEIDNNFGYEKITQLVDNIPLKEASSDNNAFFLLQWRAGERTLTLPKKSDFW